MRIQRVCILIFFALKVKDITDVGNIFLLLKNYSYIFPDKFFLAFWNKKIIDDTCIAKKNHVYFL